MRTRDAIEFDDDDDEYEYEYDCDYDNDDDNDYDRDSGEDMLPPDTIDEIDNYWVAHLGCPPAELFDARVVVIPHSAFKGYQGLFLVRRGGNCIISTPAELIDLIHTHACDRSVGEVFGSGLWREVFADLIERVVGPGFVSYCDASNFRPQPLPGTLPLGETEQDALQTLRRACEPEAWDHAGLLPSLPLIQGHWVGGELLAAAGFEVWGGRIAHIGAITHPAHRGRGYGKAVVGAAAGDAIERGLIAQFRSLETNAPALAVARALGFEPYAETFAIGLNVPRIVQCLRADTAAGGDDDRAEDE